MYSGVVDKAEGGRWKQEVFKKFSIWQVNDTLALVAGKSSTQLFQLFVRGYSSPALISWELHVSTTTTSESFGQHKRPGEGCAMGFILMHLPTIRQGQNKRANLSVSNTICAGIFQFEANGYRIVNIIKVLGEGGFSFVYLAQDEHSGVSVQ